MLGSNSVLGITNNTAHPLSFVRHRADWTTNFWAPERTGDYAADCAAGRAAAIEMQQFIQERHCPNVYASIVRDMTLCGQWTGFEVGFCTEVGIIVAVNGAWAASA